MSLDVFFFFLRVCNIKIYKLETTFLRKSVEMCYVRAQNVKLFLQKSLFVRFFLTKIIYKKKKKIKNIDHRKLYSLYEKKYCITFIIKNFIYL